MKERRENFTLSPASIDKMSNICAEALSDAEIGKKDILRIRLSLEEILGVWLERLGSANAVCIQGKRGRRNFVEFSVEGSQLDPGSEDTEAEFLLTSRLLADAGLALSYSYSNGANRLTLTPPPKIRIGQLGQIFISIAAAALCGLICNTFSAETQKNFLSVTGPFFNMLFGALRAISTPLIFFAICSAICEMGDIATFNRFGKRIMYRFILHALFASIFAACLIIPFVVINSHQGYLGSDFSSIYKMILDIVPSDIVTPFQSGNTLQVIFIAIVFGLVLLILGDRISPVKTSVYLLNEIVNFTMVLFSRTIPLFVFLSIFGIFLSHITSGLGDFFKIPILTVAGCYSIIAIYITAASITFRLSPLLLIKKLLPVHVIGLTTASSAASFGKNLETSEHYLGIPREITHFAVPIGQVAFRPGAILEYFVVAGCLAEFFGIPVTLQWIAKAVFVITLTSIAAPPVPGAGLMMFSVIFAQLSIPQEAIAIAAVADAVLDFPTTACSVTSLQLEMIFGAEALGKLNKRVLKEPISIIEG